MVVEPASMPMNTRLGAAFELALGDDLLVVAVLELGKVLVGGKERIQTLDLGTLCVAQGIDGLMSCGTC